MSLRQYYLSSLESYALSGVRTCILVKIRPLKGGKECAIAQIAPAIPKEAFSLKEDLHEVVLVGRHAGHTQLGDIREFPCFVHVARALTPDVRTAIVVDPADLEVIAWGELYLTRGAAENHVFG